MIRRIGIAGAFAALAAVSTLTYTRVRHFRDDVSWRQHTREVIERVDAAEEAFLEADSARRAYRLGKDPTDRTELEGRLLVGAREVAAIRFLTRDNLSQRVRLHDLETPLAARVAIIREGLELPSFDLLLPADREEARATQKRGSKLAQTTSAMFDAMRAEEKRLLVTREAAAASSAEGVEEAILYGSVPAMILALLVFIELSRDHRREVATNLRLLDQAEELTVLMEALEQQASRDPLTNLFNRRHVNELLVRELSRGRRRRCSLAVAMLDVDHFKQINDRYGHGMGDDVLRILAERLQTGVRPLDVVARYGGEEFLIVMPDCENAFAAGDRIRRMIANDAVGGIDVSVSIGVTSGLEGDDVESIVRRADAAMYLAKENGRNRVKVR